MTSKRITSAGYEQASQDIQAEDNRMSTARAKAVDEIAALDGRSCTPLQAGEMEYHTAAAVELHITEGIRKANKYLADLHIRPKDVRTIRTQMSETLAKLAEAAQDANKGLSMARHDHVYEKAMEIVDLPTALRAQAGLDRITAVNNTTEDSEAVTRGILSVMKEVYKDADKDSDDPYM